MALTLQATMQLDTAQFTAALKGIRAEADAAKASFRDLSPAGIMSRALSGAPLKTASNVMATALKGSTDSMLTQAELTKEAMAGMESPIEKARSGFDALGKAAAGSGEGFSSIRQQIRLISAASGGNVIALAKLGSQYEALGAIAARVLLPIAAFKAGWDVGNKIGDWMWPKLLEMNDTMAESGEKARAMRHEMENLDKVKLDNLRNEAKAAAEALAETVRTMQEGDRVYFGAKSTKRGGERELAMAKIEAMDEGTAKERALAEQKKKQRDEDIKMERTKAKGDLFAAQQLGKPTEEYQAIIEASADKLKASEIRFQTDLERIARGEKSATTPDVTAKETTKPDLPAA